jgi:hypothetical protein
VLWLAYGVLLLPLWLGGGSLVARVIGGNDAIDGIGLVILQVWPAVAVAVAVTRHGLYAIDRLVNRTLVYAALMGILVATYALVAFLSGLVVGGSAASASFATLAAVLAFRPLHGRVQRIIDRRFAPARFEATRCCASFSRMCATGAPSRRTSARWWPSRSGIRRPRCCSACRRPAPTLPAAGASSTRCPRTPVRA